MVKPLIQTTGRRKDAVARVRLREVAGEPSVTVNGRAMEDYFPLWIETAQRAVSI